MNEYKLMVMEYYPDVKCHRLPDNDGIYHIYVPNLQKVIGHGNDEDSAYKYAFLKTIQPLKRIESRKPYNDRLIIAGALIAAEIDRLNAKPPSIIN